MESAYTEKITPEMAKELLHDEYKDSFDYFLVTTLYNFVLVAKDKETGEETEITLESDVDLLDEFKSTEEEVSPSVVSDKSTKILTIVRRVVLFVVILCSILSVMIILNIFK